MRRILLLLLAITISKLSSSQIFIEPFGGYQKDVNNTAIHLLNSGIQLAFKKRKYELLVQVQKSWPQSSGYTDSSFTLNTALPLYAAAQKKLRASFFSLAIGNRIKVAGGKTNNGLFVKLYTGIMYQKMTVSYQYDKNNYVILNPDKTVDQTGLYFSGGLEYMRQFKENRLFFELNFSSPPTGHYNYPVSFNRTAPLSVNLGYSIQLSKK